MAVTEIPPIPAGHRPGAPSADPGESGPHAAWIGLFADFVKLTALLPPSNERVRETSERCLEAFRIVFEEREDLELTIDQGRVRCGDTTVEVEYRPSLRWLVERLDRTGVARLRFTPALTRESLLEFCARLQENCGNLGSSVLFSDLWPAGLAGLEPVERRFDGAFPVGAGSSGTVATRWKTASRQGQMLAEMLDSDESLQGRLAALQQVLESSAPAAPSDEPRRRVDLIGRLINLLPAEAMADPSRMREMADELLTRITAAIADGAPASDTAQVDHLLHRVSRKYFFRAAEAGPRPGPLSFAPPTEAAEPAPPPIGTRTETEERVDELLAELDGIAPLVHERRLLDRVTDELERLGVLLHFFVRLEDEELVERLRGFLVPSLAPAVPGRSALLQAHIAQARERFAAALERRQLHRLFDLLCDPSLKSLAEESRLFGVENVVEVFPATFHSFLDSLDPDRPEDLDALAEVCGRIGPARMRDAASHLVLEGGFSRHGRTAKVLRRPRPELLSLYHVLLRVEPAAAPAVAEALRALDLDARLSGPLRILSDEEVPVDYLLALTTEPSRHEGDERRVEAAAGLLAEFVTRTDEESAARRLEAIPMLGVLKCETARKGLEELSSTRRRLLAPSEGEPFREAVRRALSRYET
ncbi:MAG: hypothetical protein ACF8XB_21755 [Planctomycetota bacterium JB042]